MPPPPLIQLAHPSPLRFSLFAPISEVSHIYIRLGIQQKVLRAAKIAPRAYCYNGWTKQSAEDAMRL